MSSGQVLHQEIQEQCCHRGAVWGKKYSYRSEERIRESLKAEVAFELNNLKSGPKKINRNKICIFEDGEEGQSGRIRSYERTQRGWNVLEYIKADAEGLGDWLAGWLVKCRVCEREAGGAKDEVVTSVLGKHKGVG